MASDSAFHYSSSSSDDEDALNNTQIGPTLMELTESTAEASQGWGKAEETVKSVTCTFRHYPPQPQP